MTAPETRTLFPLVLVPQDMTECWREHYTTALDTAVDAALDWWCSGLGFRPFYAAPSIAIGGNHVRAWYDDGPLLQTRIREELAAYYPELAGEIDSGVVYLVYACLGSGPYRCPGDTIGDGSDRKRGPAVLVVQSSGALDAFLHGENPFDPSTGSRKAQTGALAHELGHALGLPHPADEAARDYSVMFSWWRFPRVGLSRAETAIAVAGATRGQHMAAVVTAR